MTDTDDFETSIVGTVDSNDLLGTAKIYELPKATLQDIPRVLRAIADEMEAGEYGTTQGAAIVIEEDNGNIRTFGAGHADYYRAFALFHFGIEHLLSQRGRDFMV